jgi:hypothetical protein
MKKLHDILEIYLQKSLTLSRRIELCRLFAIHINCFSINAYV